MDQRGTTNVLLALIVLMLFALLMTQTCTRQDQQTDQEVSSGDSSVSIENAQKNKPVAEVRTRIHLLSDVSGRLYMPEDLNPAPRDLDFIREILLTILTSKKSYGISTDGILNQQYLDSLCISQSPKYVGNFAKKFPNLSFSKLRAVQSENYAIISPENMIDRFKYRSGIDKNEASLREDVKQLIEGIKNAYVNYDSKGVNTLAALENYISNIDVDDSFEHVFVILTDGYVNTNDERIWSPSQIRKARLDSNFKTGLFRESSVSLENSKLILLETGGRDFDPMIGVKGGLTDNDLLKEFWAHWAQSAGAKEVIWKTKWDSKISRDWIEKNILE
jgi:hypothetical protein